jgi:hypothetical protein
MSGNVSISASESPLFRISLDRGIRAAFAVERSGQRHTVSVNGLAQAFGMTGGFIDDQKTDL